LPSNISESAAAGGGDLAHCDNEDVIACLEIKPDGINDTGNLSVFIRISRDRVVAAYFQQVHGRADVIVHRDFLIVRRL
jgi:hypothetical protein